MRGYPPATPAMPAKAAPAVTHRSGLPVPYLRPSQLSICVSAGMNGITTVMQFAARAMKD